MYRLVVSNKSRFVNKGVGIFKLQILLEPEDKLTISIFVIRNISKFYLHGAKDKVFIPGSKSSAETPILIESMEAIGTINSHHINGNKRGKAKT